MLDHLPQAPAPAARSRVALVGRGRILTRVSRQHFIPLFRGEVLQAVRRGHAPRQVD